MAGSRSLTRGTSSASRRTFFPSPARRARAKTLMRTGVYRRPMADQRWAPTGAPGLSGSGCGPGVAGVRTAHELALQALHLVFKLVDHQIDGHGDLGRRRPGPDGVSVAGHGHLTDLAGGPGAVTAFGEPDLGPFEDGGDPGQAGHLGLGQRADLVGNRLLASEHKNIHCRTSSDRVLRSSFQFDALRA